MKSYSNQNAEILSSDESVFSFKTLKRVVEKIIKPRVKKFSDAEDITQNVFHRSWKWAEKHDKVLSTKEWKSFIAKVTFNEINRFYSKKTEQLVDDRLPENSRIETPDYESINPQFILEIVEQLRSISFRQRLAIVFYEGTILSYIRLILTQQDIANLLEIDVELLREVESDIPLSEERIKQLIEKVTKRVCRSSIRDERCKGRRRLKRGIYRK